MYMLSQAAAEYTIRVTFGTALIASIVIVFTAIIALLSSRRFVLKLTLYHWGHNVLICSCFTCKTIELLGKFPYT